MYASKYNLIFGSDSDYSLIFNPLSGALDLVKKEIVKTIFDDGNAKKTEISPEIINMLRDRGYLFSNKEEEYALIEKAYKFHEKIIASTPERFLVIPTYFCNLRCAYCYQRELDRKADLISEDVMKAMFDAFLRIRNKRTNSYKPPVVMLFGGEPLIHRQKQPEIIELILAECQKMGCLTKIITNGVDLEFFTDLISAYNVVRHVHITMDGPKSIHDKRRRYANGEGTFDKIVRGIDSAIEKGINIEIHVNLDRENIKALPQFADFIIQKGWMESKLVHSHLSAVQQGTCSGEGNCMTWSSICNRVFQFYDTKPQTSVFSLDLPLVQLFEKIIKGKDVLTQRFAYCGANTKMFVFDLYGDIYVCNGNVGNKEFSVGRFYPRFKIDSEKLTSWRNRNILTIPECRDCRLSLLCGGGCGAAALRKNGTLGAPFCEPVEESLKCISKYYASRLKEVLLPTVTPRRDPKFIVANTTSSTR